MPSDPTPLPVISYEPAKVFFRGEQRSRSLVMIWPLVICAVFIAIGSGVLGSNASGSRAARIAHLAFLIFGLSVGAGIVVGILLDSRRPFEIRSDGILWGRRMRPWALISRVGAFESVSGKAVELYFTSRRAGIPVIIPAGSAGRMERADYEALMEQLRQEVGPHHPHVVLETKYERQTD